MVWKAAREQRKSGSYDAIIALPFACMPKRCECQSRIAGSLASQLGKARTLLLLCSESQL